MDVKKGNHVQPVDPWTCNIFLHGDNKSRVPVLSILPCLVISSSSFWIWYILCSAYQCTSYSTWPMLLLYLFLPENKWGPTPAAWDDAHHHLLLCQLQGGEGGGRVHLVLGTITHHGSWFVSSLWGKGYSIQCLCKIVPLSLGHSNTWKPYNGWHPRTAGPGGSPYYVLCCPPRSGTPRRRSHLLKNLQSLLRLSFSRVLNKRMYLLFYLELMVDIYAETN